MANIREYDNPIADLQPSEAGARTTAQEASHQAQAFNDVGNSIGGGLKTLGDVAVKHATYQDTTALAGKSATLLADKMLEWNDLVKKSDPNDPTVAADFLKNNLQPALDKLRDSAWTEGGQQYAGNQADSIFAHLSQVTRVDMAQKAGEGAITAVAQAANAMSVAAATDPAGVENYIKMLDATIDQIVKGNPAITAEVATKLHESIRQTAVSGLVKSAVTAAIQANPDEGLKFATKPALAPYINGAEVKQFEAFSRAQKHQDDTDRRLAQADDRRQAEQKSQDAIGDYETKLYDESGNLAPPKNFTKTILNDPRILPKDKGPFLSMVNRLVAGGNAKSDTDGLVNHLLTSLDDITPADVYQYVGANNPTGKQLTQASANFVLSALKGSAEQKQAAAILVSGIHQAQATVAPIDNLTGRFTAADSDQRRRDLDNAARLLYTEGIAAGKRPLDLLTPGRPDYIFSKEFLDQYRKSQSGTSGILGGLPPPVATPGSVGKSGGRVNENAPPAPAPPAPLNTPAPAAAPVAAPEVIPPRNTNVGTNPAGYSDWQKKQPSGADVTFGAYQRSLQQTSKPSLDEIFGGKK